MKKYWFTLVPALFAAAVLTGCSDSNDDPPPFVFPEGALTKAQSDAVIEHVTTERNKRLTESLKTEWDAKVLKNGTHQMKFWTKTFGTAQPGNRSLYISLHGGGGTTADVNDGQWENQKNLYKPTEGLYFVPRAPTNTWDLWHQSHIDDLLRKTIAGAVLFEGVNPDKVYIMGYSAGGDGVYQLGPRLADHWAAAAMMAGHPNDAHAESLRNLPFAIYMGGQDAAYNRNDLAREWGVKLDGLAAADGAGGYVHDVHIFEDKGHWMDLKDAIALPWMAQYTRTKYPKKVVWVQDDVLRDNFYWVGVPSNQRVKDHKVIASISGQTVTIEEMDPKVLLIGLNDQMMNLDQPVTVVWKGNNLGAINVQRTSANLQRSLNSSTYTLDAPYPVILKVEESGGNATVSEL